MRAGHGRTALRVLLGLLCYPLVWWFLTMWTHALFSEPGPIPGMRVVSTPVMMATFGLALLIPSGIIAAAARYDWNVLYDTFSYVAGFAALPFLIALVMPSTGSSAIVPGAGVSHTEAAATTLIWMAAALVFPLARRLLARRISRFSP